MSATPRQIRRFAFQILFLLDAQGEMDDADLPKQDSEELSEKDRQRALALARAAHENRFVADELINELAPKWPVHRQPAVDRALLRLAHYEMTAGNINPKIAVNEAVELAKSFSTDKSPSFVNGVLDKILKRVLNEQSDATPATPTNE